MKKIILTMLIAMLAACGQQDTNSSTSGGDLYTIKIKTSQDELRKDDDKIIASVQVVRDGGSVLSAEEVQALNLVFMVDKGLVYETAKDKPLVFTVQREIDSKILGDLKLTASIDDAEVAVKTIKVVRGNIEFVDMPDQAADDQIILVNVRANGLGDDLSKHKLTAFLNGKEVGTGLTDKEGKAKFNIKLANNGSEDIVSTIKVAQVDNGLEGERQIKVQPAIKEGLKIELIDKHSQKAAQGLLVGTSVKATKQLKISAIGNKIVDGSKVALNSSKIGVQFGGIKNSAECTLVAKTCIVDISNETTGQANLSASAGGFKAEISVEFVPSVAKSMEIIASPSTINERDSKYKKNSYSSTLIVRLLSEDYIPGTATAQGVGVPNQIVKFLLPNANMGAFEPASNEVVTDSQGYATITYVAPTTAQKVKIQVQHIKADYSNTLERDFYINVQKRHLAIAVGYGTGIKVVDANGQEDKTGDFYIKSLTVVVTDNTGKSINGAQVRVTTNLAAAETGCLAWGGDKEKGKWTKVKKVGKKLTNIDNLTSGLTISSKGLNDERSEFETQNNGVVQIDLRYLRSYAWWVNSNISINVELGNQAANVNAIFDHPVLVDDMNAETPTPANVFSPFNPADFDTAKCVAPPPPSPPPSKSTP